jgi:hypothetical protein
VTDLPEKRREQAPPPRRLTSEEFELVIRRAAELQSRSADEAGLEGVAEEEALRIGRELGLSGPHLARALAEVRAGPQEEPGLAVRVMGTARITAARAVRGEAAAVTRSLDLYLVEQEFLVVQRRFADRTVYVRAKGVLAAVARTTTGIFRKAPLLEVETLDVSVRQLEPALSYVTLGTDLTGDRTGHLVGGSVAGGVAGGVSALALSIAVAPVAAVVGIPIAAAVLGGMRYAYGEKARKVQDQLEALLDRLEHGELRRP